MTDSGRKDISDKIQDSITPDKSKSTLDKAGDAITGGADKVGRDAVPDSQKSNTQAVMDKVSREKDAHKGGDSVTDKAASAVTSTGASNTDKSSNAATGTGASPDKGARDAAPDSQKPSTQAAADKTSRGTDANKGGDSILNKAKAAVGMDKH